MISGDCCDLKLLSDDVITVLGTAQTWRQVSSMEKWQQWDHTTKGLATKTFFPNIKDRLKRKSP